MSMEYIRSYYGVKVKRGDHVTVDGRTGKVTGADGQYLRVLFVGEKKPVNVHPTWRVIYDRS